MRALVTGGMGFLGSHLTDMLVQKGWTVAVVDNLVTGDLANLDHQIGKDRVEFWEADACLPYEVGRVDYVFHFASPASPVDFLRRPLDVMRVNSQGTEVALEYARKYRAKFLVASTSEVYGDPLVTPQEETYRGNVSTIGVRSCYDEGKRYAEALTMAYHREYGMDTRIVRFFNTYGPRMRLDDGRVVPNMVGQALRGEPITVYGSGRQTRSFGYVDDVIDGVFRLASADFHEPVNIGSDDERTIHNFAVLVQAATGTKSEIVFEEAAEDDPQQRCPSLARAEKILDWRPTTAIGDGLDLTIKSFRARLSDTAGQPTTLREPSNSV